jgi:signal transduction histidine kinase
MSILLVDGAHLRVAAMAGEVPGDLVDQRIPIEGSTAGEVLRANRPMRLNENTAHDGHPFTGDGAMLLVPLNFRGRAVGVLDAYDRVGARREFDPEDERLMLAFAASAATAVATAKSVEAERLRHSMEASEQERRRWARELHDETLQGLGAPRVMLSTGLKKGTQEALERSVSTALEHISSEIDNLRALITDLRPAALDELGTGAALDGLIERVAAGHGSPAIIAHIDLAYEQRREATRHSPALESALYRLVQEAITNAIKHGGAGTIEISVVENGGAIDVRVTDDGSGFDPQAVEAGFGLIGMHERVALVDGPLDVPSQPGAGATVHAVIPAVRRPHQRPAAATA